MDLFTLNDRNYLPFAAYYSKYPVIYLLGSSSSRKTIAQLTSTLFSLFGIPNTVISDNGPQFVRQPFKDLLKWYGVTHISSSPLHPKSHGLIERTICSIKALICKTPEDTDRAMLAFRTAPLGPQLPSPAEILFCRKLQTTLPAYNRLASNSKLHEYRAASRDQSQANYDARSKELPELQLNQPIFYQDVTRKTWSPGTIIDYGSKPRSYTITCDDTGRALQGNRVLLRPRHVTFSESPRTSAWLRSAPDDVAWPEPQSVPDVTAAQPAPVTTMLASRDWS